eukprot:444844-Amphidinium_carterae.1
MAGLRQHIHEKHAVQVASRSGDSDSLCAPLLDWVIMTLLFLVHSTTCTTHLNGAWTCLELVAACPPGEEMGWERLWTCMDVDAECVELLIHYQLKWRAETGRLRVCRSSVTEDEDMVSVTGIIYKLLRIQVFTESRWLSIGQSCRALTAMAIGLDTIASITRANPNVSDYYIEGFMRAGEDSRFYAACAALSAHVADTAHVSLLEDDRLVRTWQGVFREMQVE